MLRWRRMYKDETSEKKKKTHMAAYKYAKCDHKYKTNHTSITVVERLQMSIWSVKSQSMIVHYA